MQNTYIYKGSAPRAASLAQIIMQLKQKRGQSEDAHDLAPLAN